MLLNAEAPPFALEGVAGGVIRRYTLAEFRGRWLVLFFYPSDFTFICPTEVLGFQQRRADFEAAGAAVAGVSIDAVESHRDWAEELGGIAYPLLSDPGREACRAYEVLAGDDDRPCRATFLISPESRISHFTASPLNVGRSVEETLRVLQALQTGRLCPADWKPGQPTLDPQLQR